jgi:hypothetical protein
MCQTLDKTIVLETSDVQLLKDFICIKLVKSDNSETWNSTGYDISNFTIPPDGSPILSNFLKQITKEEPKVEPEPEEEPEEEAEAVEPEPELTEEEK